MSAHSTSVMVLAPHRVGAMVVRYLYLLRSSWTRLLELIYWPAVQLFVWGFLQFYIAQNSGFFARATGVFIAAVLMWDILFRGQLGFSVSFLEEMWSRNLSNLMISPLRPLEFVCALMIMSIIRLAIGMVPVTFLAIAFFDFNFYSLGFALAEGAFIARPPARLRHARARRRGTRPRVSRGHSGRAGATACRRPRSCRAS